MGAWAILSFEDGEALEQLASDMVMIPAGAFVMGSPESEAGRRESEGPQRPVRFADPFLMGKYAVTQAQWRSVAQMPQVNLQMEPNPSKFKGKNRPVERINWCEAIEFCDRLSHHTGSRYRLPTEAEWEYACRAGTTTPFHFGETLSTEWANYDGRRRYGLGAKGECRNATTEVGRFPANAFGLYDMHGNVWEWCQDPWRSPDGGEDVIWRGVRGGSWGIGPGACRSATRLGHMPDHWSDRLGVRVMCAIARA